MAFIQGGFNAGQNPFINQFPTSFGAPAFGGAQQSFGFNPQQAQMMFMLQALMQAMQQMSQGWGGFAGGGGQQVPQVGGGGGGGCGGGLATTASLAAGWATGADD